MSKLLVIYRRSSRLATPHTVVYVLSENITKQCNNALCLYVRYTIDRVTRSTTICKLNKKSSASPTSNHDRTAGSFSLHPHGRIFHRLGFGLLARCCLPACWDVSGIMAGFSCFPGTCCSPQPRHTILSLPFFKYFSFFPWSSESPPSCKTYPLTHEWPRVGRVIKFIQV
jgi:hypothetical protein